MAALDTIRDTEVRRSGLGVEADPDNHLEFVAAHVDASDEPVKFRCLNEKEISVHIRTSSPSQSADIFLNLYDADDVFLFPTDTETLTSKARPFIGEGDNGEEDPRFASPPVTFDTYGAAYFRIFYEDAVTEGECDIYAGVR